MTVHNLGWQIGTDFTYWVCAVEQVPLASFSSLHFLELLVGPKAAGLDIKDPKKIGEVAIILLSKYGIAHCVVLRTAHSPWLDMALDCHGTEKKMRALLHDAWRLTRDMVSCCVARTSRAM